MIQRLRLLSGLVLFTYVTTHLLNHALGLESLRLAEAGRVWFLAAWRSPLGTVLLYGALAAHIVLALLAVYRRRHLRLPWWELLRLGLGLLIPLLLFQHVVRTRLAHELAGIEDDYARQMLSYWVLDPQAGARQIVLLVIAWTHGCIGVYVWLRARARWAIVPRAFRMLAFVVPTLALGGFWDLGQEVAIRANDAEWVQVTFSQPTPTASVVLDGWRDALVGGFVGLVGLTLAGRQARALWQRRRGVVRIGYPDGRQAAVPPGASVLEASRLIGYPHASLCGGRGRCSTCRVRVAGDPARLPRPSAAEARVLRQIGAPTDVRLACQLRPDHDVLVFPLLPPSPGTRAGAARTAQGAEQEIAILFADLRGFSRLAERRLPYDIVFILNQYFAAVGEAIERSGGYVDKFLGDGVMALFGLRGGPRQGCRQALQAAAEIGAALGRLNASLGTDLGEPLRIGIGIHVGAVVIGELGYGRARSLTAVGDAVNVASRLEQLTKEYGGELVISARVAELAGLDAARLGARRLEVAVRGRAGPLAIYVLGTTAVLHGAPIAAPAPLPGGEGAPSRPSGAGDSPDAIS